MTIFVTVGAQMSFDRLVRSVDLWADQRNRTDVFAQIGPSDFRPRRMNWTTFLEPPEFRQCAVEADLLIGHAGMGSIITAMELGKPILIMPRRGDLHETRNDHQLATARRFRDRPGITVAMDETELPDRLDQAVASCRQTNGCSPIAPISSVASDTLIQAIRRFIFEQGPNDLRYRP